MILALVLDDSNNMLEMSLLKNKEDILDYSGKAVSYLRLLLPKDLVESIIFDLGSYSDNANWSIPVNVIFGYLYKPINEYLEFRYQANWLHYFLSDIFFKRCMPYLFDEEKNMVSKFISDVSMSSLGKDKLS